MSRSVRPTRSTASFASTATSATSTAPSSLAATSIVRTLNFTASLPVEFTLAPAPDSANPAADRTFDRVYLQVARIAYLPLVVQTIRRQLLALALADDADVRDEHVWFQDAHTGQYLKPHWPVGLLYDYLHAATHPALPSPPSPSPAASSASSLASVFAPFDSPSLLSTTSSIHDTLRAPPSRASSSSRSASSSSHHLPFPASLPPATAAGPAAASSVTVQRSLTPWRVVVHCDPHDPPPSASAGAGPSTLTDPSGLLECKSAFMARWKEGDYVRYGSSKKRLVNLRREEQDALWDGVVLNEFEKFWSVANKLIPPPPVSMGDTTTVSYHVNPIGGGGGGGGTANSDLKGLAVRVYLAPSSPPPPGSNAAGGGGGGDGTILTCPVAPFTPSGQPTTLGSYLSNLLPSLFPPPPASTSASAALGPPHSTSTTTTPTAHAIVQGIRVPLESELGWLASCMAGMDGWVNVVVAVVP
ncbi:hypothetical protein JCM11491_005020 [Sporobolomyces phaffii]